MAKTTASLLPVVPRVFFLYLEPVIITIGILKTYANRLPLLSSLPLLQGRPDIPALSTAAISCTYLLGMMLYGLIILLSSPPNKRLLKQHIGILMLADLVHWYALFSTMAEANGGDWAAVLDTASWDPKVWDLAVYPACTFAFKFATLMEWFGTIKP